MRQLHEKIEGTIHYSEGVFSMIKNLLLVFFFMFITILAFAFNNGSNCAECRNEKTVKG